MRASARLAWLGAGARGRDKADVAFLEAAFAIADSRATKFSAAAPSRAGPKEPTALPRTTM